MCVTSVGYFSFTWKDGKILALIPCGRSSGYYIESTMLEANFRDHGSIDGSDGGPLNHVFVGTRPSKQNFEKAISSAIVEV